MEVDLRTRRLAPASVEKVVSAEIALGRKQSRVERRATEWERLDRGPRLVKTGYPTHVSSRRSSTGLGDQRYRWQHEGESRPVGI